MIAGSCVATVPRQDEFVRRVGFMQCDSVVSGYLSASRLSARFRVLDVCVIVAIDVLLTLPVGSRRIRPAARVWAGQFTGPGRVAVALAEVFLDVAFVALLMDSILGYFHHSSIEAGSG